MPISVILMHLGTELQVSPENDLLFQLTNQEQRRARSMSVPWLRRNYILCHAALHEIVRDRFNSDLPNSFRISSTGKPSFDSGPYVSLSRARAWAAIGVCHEQPRGIDLALNEPRMGNDCIHKYPGLASRIRSRRDDGSLNFLRAWTEIEAVAKLRQLPMEHLLERPQADPSFLATFVNSDLVVTIACETYQDIEIEWASWKANGTLQTMPARIRRLSIGD